MSDAIPDFAPIPAVRSPTKTPRRHAIYRRPKWVTPEREAALREAYPRGEHREAILALLAALPGPAVRHWTAVVGFCERGIGLRRPYGRPQPREGWHTPARIDLLVEAYPRGDKPADVMVALAAIPGPKMPTWRTVTSYCNNRMGLHRRFGYRREDQAPLAARPGGVGVMEIMVPVQTVSRDGAPSVAGLIERRALRDANEARIDAAEIVAWARRNRVPTDGRDTEDIAAAVNAVRLEWGLPPFRVTAIGGDRA